jgi:hypothetical protein
MSTLNSKIDAHDTVLLFADLQAGVVELTRTNPLDVLKKGVLCLAKLGKLFDMPAIVTGVRGEGGSPAVMIPEIAEGFGTLETIHRMTCDSFLNKEIVAAVEATGRKTILIAGVATELVVQLAALAASDRGYRAYVVLDACGGVSERTEQAALLRMVKAGVTTTSVMTLAGELAGDFSDPKAQQAIEIVYTMATS